MVEKKKTKKRTGKSGQYECESCGNTAQEKQECCGEPMKKKEGKMNKFLAVALVMSMFLMQSCSKKESQFPVPPEPGGANQTMNQSLNQTPEAALPLEKSFDKALDSVSNATESHMSQMNMSNMTFESGAGGSGVGAMQEAQTVKKNEFTVYVNRTFQGNHYIPSGWMGDYGDIKMNDHYTADCHSQSGCVQFAYSAKRIQGQGWAGVYWQNPPNNWGTKKGGYDLTGMKKLTFWARGEKGGEKMVKFMMGGITGQYADSDSAEIGPLDLTKEWKQYIIDLSGKDLSYISGGFGWVTSADLNPDGCIFYVDDIKYQAA